MNYLVYCSVNIGIIPLIGYNENKNVGITMFMTVKQAAEKWGISDRRI